MKLDFLIGQAGKHDLKLMFMSDSYVGCDQEHPFNIDVKQGAEMEDESESSDDDDESGSEESD